MQIREQGKKIQLIRTHYSKDKKRTEGKVFCSFDKHLQVIPDFVRQQLDRAEIAKIEDYLSSRIEKQAVEILTLYLSTIDQGLYQAAKALSVDEIAGKLTDAKAVAIYAAMDELKKALKKAGYAKPKPAPKTTIGDSRQSSLLDTD